MTHPSQPKFPSQDANLWVELGSTQGAQITGGWWGYHTTSVAGTPVARSIVPINHPPSYDYGYYGLPPQP